MEYTQDRLIRQASETIVATQMASAAQIELVAPKPNIPADLAFPTFKAARDRQIPPPQLATELASQISFGGDSLLATATAAGPFLNFSINAPNYVASVLADVARLGNRYGSDDLGANKRIVIDYSSVNIAKLMHVGHIRSTIIGQALYNIFKFLGYTVIGDNHLGDYGKQFGMNIAAIVKWGKPSGHDEEALAQLDKLYAQYSREAKEDESLHDAARMWSLKLEQGDATATELWQWMVDLTLTAIQENYDRLGVKFDHAYGESFYAPLNAGVIAEALASGLAHRDEGGAVVVNELEQNMPTFLLQRSDTGTLYHTRDMGCIKYRMETFTPSQIIYVVGSPQELHFRQLFALSRAIGYVPAGVELSHVKFGTIFDQHGKPLSTRAGNMIYLTDLLNDARDRARLVVDASSPDLSEAERADVAEKVGIGAVMYNDLYQDSRRNITLEWDRMLAIEGNSAPYIQYMYARCRSIARRILGDQISATIPACDASLLSHPSELDLVRQIARMPSSVRDAADRYATFVIAEWCYDTARAFAGFYRDCPVAKAEDEALRTARLALTVATAQALKNGLGLLGIGVAERM
ncbi:MAG: arginine--tRNA ligase [Chloroflexales bacterium]|nr:arginine--tRNA ligase [Chloroflexales bacterium]